MNHFEAGPGKKNLFRTISEALKKKGDVKVFFEDKDGSETLVKFKISEDGSIVWESQGRRGYYINFFSDLGIPKSAEFKVIENKTSENRELIEGENKNETNGSDPEFSKQKSANNEFKHGIGVVSKERLLEKIEEKGILANQTFEKFLDRVERQIPSLSYELNLPEDYLRTKIYTFFYNFLLSNLKNGLDKTSSLTYMLNGNEASAKAFLKRIITIDKNDAWLSNQRSQIRKLGESERKLLISLFARLGFPKMSLYEFRNFKIAFDELIQKHEGFIDEKNLRAIFNSKGGQVIKLGPENILNLLEELILFTKENDIKFESISSIFSGRGINEKTLSSLKELHELYLELKKDDPDLYFASISSIFIGRRISTGALGLLEKLFHKYKSWKLENPGLKFYVITRLLYKKGLKEEYIQELDKFVNLHTQEGIDFKYVLAFQFLLNKSFGKQGYLDEWKQLLKIIKENKIKLYIFLNILFLIRPNKNQRKNTKILFKAVTNQEYTVFLNEDEKEIIFNNLLRFYIREILSGFEFNHKQVEADLSEIIIRKDNFLDKIRDLSVELESKGEKIPESYPELLLFLSEKLRLSVPALKTLIRLKNKRIDGILSLLKGKDYSRESYHRSLDDVLGEGDRTYHEIIGQEDENFKKFEMVESLKSITSKISHPELEALFEKFQVNGDLDPEDYQKIFKLVAELSDEEKRILKTLF